MEVHSLRVGDSFGYSDLLKVVGPEYLGEIRVSEGQDAECIMLTDPESYIQFHERKTLQTLLREDYSVFKTMMETRHPHLLATTKK